MNKYTIITIISIIVIASTIGYGFLNSYFADNLQFKWAGIDDFNLFSLVYGGTFHTCNTSEFPVSFKKYSIEVINDKNSLGTFVLDGDTIPPRTSKILNGKFNAESQTLAGVTSLLIDTELKGTDVLRLDAKKVFIITNIQTDILGFIPHSVSKQYSGYDFFELMNKKTDCE